MSGYNKKFLKDYRLPFHATWGDISALKSFREGLPDDVAACPVSRVIRRYNGFMKKTPLLL